MNYALLRNNQIVVGPRDYRVSFFNQYLTENGVQSELPSVYSGTDPITINGTYQIVPVMDAIIPQYSTLTEQLVGPLWDTSVIPITGAYTVTDRDLTAAKNDLKERLANFRYKKETAGTTVNIQGQSVFVSTDRGDDRNIWFQSSVLLPAGSTQMFKFPGDVWINLTKSDIDMVVSAITTTVQAAFNWENVQAIDIDAAQDKSALETILVNITPAPPANLLPVV
jgi:hypothetical protein